MSKLEIWINIIQTAISILGFLGVGFIPQYFYQRRLTKLKNEIKQLHISVEQNHPIKMERYKNFVENFFDYGQIKDEKKKQQKLLKSFKDISNAVFLFGSDETMKSFLVLREGTSDNPTEEETMKYLVDAARFMVHFYGSFKKGFKRGQNRYRPGGLLEIIIKRLGYI